MIRRGHVGGRPSPFPLPLVNSKYWAPRLAEKTAFGLRRITIAHSELELLFSSVVNEKKKGKPADFQTRTEHGQG